MFAIASKGDDLLLYNKCLKLFFSGTAGLVILRCLLKILYVDNQSGFYNSGEFVTLIFNILTILTVAGVIILTLIVKDQQPAKIRGGKWLELFSIILGIAILFVSIGALIKTMAIDTSLPVVNALPQWILLIEHFLGILSGMAFLYLAFFMHSGAKAGSLKGISSLTVVLWQAFMVIERFISFQQVTTVSDQLFETLFMVLFILFMLYHTKCAGDIAANRSACIRRALLTAVFGITVSVGQLAATGVFGSAITGPSIERSIVILASSVYAVCFALNIAANTEEV